MIPLERIHHPRGFRTGAALPLALIVLLLVSVVGFTLVTLGMTEVNISTNWKTYSTAFYAADAGIESGIANLRTLLQNNQSPLPSDLNKMIKAPTPSVSGVTFANYAVTQLQGPTATTLTTGPYAGFNAIVTDYQITSWVTGPGGAKANLTQTYKYIQIPLFQFGLFYGKGVDLELRPGPAMDFDGKIFANSNIYIAAGTTLKVRNPTNPQKATLKTAGNIYRYIKAESSYPNSNNPQINDASGELQTLDFDHTYQPGFSTKWASASAWADYANKTFGSTVQDGAMGVSQIIPPVPDLFNNPTNPDVVAHQMIEMPQSGDSAALKQAKLYTQAGLRIIDGVATDQNGNSVPLPSGSISTTSFYDQREGKTVNVVQVDVDKLNNARPANGLVYVASTASPTGSSFPAVRLVNGSALPQQGLTFASQNPVYIQGDYNTKQYSGNHPSAAVLADAVSVLSNNWRDSKSTQVFQKRVASNTTVNAAIATGPDSESTLNNDNGKANNLVRYLEDWGGKTFGYNGSLVALWHSKQVKGVWRCCGSSSSYYYAPPTRIWTYDTLFDTTPPPGTPMGVIMVKGSWSQS